MPRAPEVDRYTEYQRLDDLVIAKRNPSCRRRVAPMSTLLDRYHQRRPVGAPDQCWAWTGTTTVDGYGQISDGRRRTLLAHRLTYDLEVGPIPDGLQVCHRCDNPPCCNPAHLFLGSAAENQHDKGRKGRAARGEANRGGGRLTAEDVRSIRAALAAGETLTSIGSRHGVSRQMVAAIRDRRKWAHL